MKVNGSCLCGGVTIEISTLSQPMEICHCNRCRKTSGSNALTSVRVLSEHLTFTSGTHLIKTYQAPILYNPPAYQVHFCSVCGSPLPSPVVEAKYTEVPAGLFDNDPGVRPDKHIFTEFMPTWDKPNESLPSYTIRDIYRERYNKELPEDFELRSHYD